MFFIISEINLPSIVTDFPTKLKFELVEEGKVGRLNVEGQKIHIVYNDMEDKILSILMREALKSKNLPHINRLCHSWRFLQNELMGEHNIKEQFYNFSFFKNGFIDCSKSTESFGAAAFINRKMFMQLRSIYVIALSEEYMRLHRCIDLNQFD